MRRLTRRSPQGTTRRRERLRNRIAVLAVAVGMLATAASAQAFVAKLKAPTHRPHAGKQWPIKVSAHRKNGKRVHASAYYQFVYQGQVVQSCKPLPSKPGGRKCNNGTTAGRYHFFGSYRDVVVWPKKSIGLPLTFRVVVHARHDGTKRLNYAVKVRR
jgi:hypothetical protein